MINLKCIDILVYENIGSAFIPVLLGPKPLMLIEYYVKNFTTVSDEGILANARLKLKSMIENMAISKNPNDISAAIYSIMNDWSKDKPDPRTAYINIQQAFEHAGIIRGGYPEEFKDSECH